MNTHILTEADFDSFIQKEIVPLIARSRDPETGSGLAMAGGDSERSRNKCGMTSEDSGITDALVFALVGDLGAGKTTFSKKLLHALGVTQNITSPTFSIINSYDINHESFKKVFHIDVYRIEDIKELDFLHFDEILSQKNTITLIEWADMIKEKIPTDAIWIEFEHDTNKTRKVSVRTDG